MTGFHLIFVRGAERVKGREREKKTEKEIKREKDRERNGGKAMRYFYGRQTDVICGNNSIYYGMK